MNATDSEVEVLNDLIRHCLVISSAPRVTSDERLAAIRLEKAFRARLKTVKAGPGAVWAWPARGFGKRPGAPELDVLHNLSAHLRIYRPPQSLVEKVAEHYLGVIKKRVALAEEIST